MKYNITLFVFLILSCLSITTANAQKNNFLVGFRGGYALPMGQFASHEFNTGGYALLGKSLSMEAAWYLSPHLGFGLDISTKTFGFASGFYRDDYLEVEPSYKSMDLLSGPYKVQTLMGGVYYKVKFSEKFSSSIKVMAGMLTARTPDQFYGVVDNLFQKENFFWKTGSLDRTFGFLAGGSFEYKVFDHVSLLLQADLALAEPAFVFDNGEELYTKKIKMPVLQILPGINIHF